MTTIHLATHLSPLSTHLIQRTNATSLSNTCYEIAKQALKNSAALAAGGALGACIGIITGLPLVATITITALTTLGIASLFPCFHSSTPPSHVLPPSKPEKKRHHKSTSSAKSPRSSSSTPRKAPVPPLRIPSQRLTPRRTSSRSARKSTREILPERQEQAPLSASIIPSFPQPQIVIEFPKDQPLPNTAEKLTIQEIASQTPARAARSNASADAHAVNIDMYLALISHYERWMKRIAADDFGIMLPPHYVQAKINDFLTVYHSHLNERATICTPEQFQYYVLNPIYDRLHSSENRRQFVEECFQLQRAEEVKQAPLSYLERQLGYDLPETQAAAVMQQVQLELDQLTPETHLHEIEVLQEKLRATLNARALETLREELRIEFGEAGLPFVDAIMNDWTYIGTDIKHNLSFLTPERIGRIKERARAAFEKSAELEERIDHLRRDFDEGLPADERLISEKYTTLDALQQEMPQAKKLQVKAEITKALALQELRNKSRYNGTQLERIVLRALGYSLDKYSDRTELHESMGAFLATLGEHEGAWTKSSRRLKQEIADYAFETRLTLAGVPRNCHQNIKNLIAQTKEIDSEWSERAATLQQEPIAEIHALERLPKARQRLYRQIQSLTRSALRREIITSIRRARERVAQNPEQWVPPSAERLSQLIQPSFHMTPKIQNQIAWLSRYQYTFVEEFSQGDNPQDALLDGVCFGKSCGLAQAVLEHPETPWHQLKPGKIHPQDRFFQSAYQHHVKIAREHSIDDVRRHSVPETLKQMKGTDFKPVCIMIHPNPDALFRTLKSQLSEIQQSNGGLIVSTCDHATFMRIDAEREIFEFTDPNFGYQKFSLNSPPGQTLDDIIHRMATCVIELSEQVYQITEREMPLISISQLIRKSEAIKRTDSFYRYPIIEC